MTDQALTGGAEAPTPRFHAMTEGTEAQWRQIARADAQFARQLPAALLQQLELLRNDCHAFAVDRLEHCLQAATRAHRAGEDDEYVVCALLHDVGALMAPSGHAKFAAMILRPYVSDENHWMVLNHNLFQQYYFAHFFGGDRNAREKHRGHACFERTAKFCHLYDQNSFDPGYDSMPLEAFAPMLHRVLGKRRG